MCGIYGKIGFGRQVDGGEGLRRTQMLNHRGPDYCGTYSKENIFLGHARLSILDLTPAGNQPFGDDNGQLVFNGEIYNWQELHSRYLNGVVLRSHSDTEILFLLLRKMGTECLSLLNGMFAFAYFVPSTKKIIIARDMTGIKPVYFVPGNNYFEFSSEIKNLDYEPDLNRLKEYLIFGRFGEDFIPYANVNEVLPGSYVELNCISGEWSQKAYREVESLVNPKAYEALASSENLVDQLDSLLQRSVSMHEQSDAPIGFLCSGGLDSSLISAISAKSHPDLALYHADFEGEGREISYAKQVSRHIGAPLQISKISKSKFWEMFAEMTHAQELPIQHPHSLSLNLIAGRVKSDGRKVLLSGEGADELFDGYYFHSAYKRLMYHNDNQSKYRRVLSKFLRRGWSRLQVDPDPYWFFGDFNSAFQNHAHVGFGDAWSLSEPIQSLSLVGQDFKAWARWQQAIEAVEWMGNKPEATALSFQLFYMRYHMQPLLHRLDRMLMNHSIEGRVPFLENEVIKFALNLQLEQKINGNTGKYLLKQVALRYLPADIVNRKKIGFAVPWGSYAKSFPNILEDGFVAEWTHLTKKQLISWVNNDPVQLYRLISIEVWGRIFVHKTPWTDIKLDA